MGAGVTEPLRVLIVEDVADDAELEARELRRAGFELDWSRVETLAELEAELARRRPDLILCDYSLPALGAPDVLRFVGEQAPDIPVLIVTGSTDEQTAVTCMRQGAWDYVLKDALALLGPATARALDRARLLTERRETEARLRRSEERYRRLVENAPFCIHELDPEGRWLSINRAGFETLDLESADALIGTSYLDSVASGDRARIAEHLEAARRGESRRFELTTADGRVMMSNFVPFADAHGEVRSVMGISADISELRRAERELRDSEAALRAFFESPGVLRGVVELEHGESRHLFDNTAAASFYGRTPEQMRGRLASELGVPPRVIQLWRERYEESRRTGRMITFDYRLRTEPPRTFEATVSFLGDGAAGPRFSFTVTDVTEVRAAAAERQLFVRTLNASLNEIYIFDAETLRFELVSAGAIANLGYSLDELRAMTPLDLKPRFDAASFAALVAPLRSGELPAIRLETVHRRADGSHYPVEVHLQLVAQDERRVFLATILDLTERKLADSRLRQLSRAVEQSSASVIITDTSGAIEYVNPSFSAITGFSAEEVYGQNPRIMKSFQTAPETYRELWAAITSGQTWQGELLNRRKNGELFWGAVSISPIVEEGRTTHFVAVKQDITELRRVEDELRRSNEELARFNRLAVGRELRMIELKREVNELARRHGEPPLYELGFAEQDEALDGGGEPTASGDNAPPSANGAAPEGDGR